MSCTSWFAKTFLIFSLEVLTILPLIGNNAWNRESRASLTPDKAESPSTIISSESASYTYSQSTNLIGNEVLLVSFCFSRFNYNCSFLD